jgi:hypothetical protein
LLLHSGSSFVDYQVRNYSVSLRPKSATDKTSCENEMRQCGLNYAFDSSAQQVLQNWHQDCDSFITFTPTTPPLTSLTATFNQQICTALESSCLSFDVEYSSCTDSYTAFTDLKSCICRPPMLSLVSECRYDGNISCKLTTAALSNIRLYSECQVRQLVPGLFYVTDICAK